MQRKTKKQRFEIFTPQQFSSFKPYRPLLKFFSIFLVVYLISVGAILSADVYYADDISRAERGYAGWSSFSRYISEFLSYFIHADSYLTDVSPLPQLLAILLSAASSTLLLYAFVGKKLFTLSWRKYVWLIISIIPLVLCPYFLECFSYKYDSIYMALSVFVALIPALLRHRKKWQYALALFACTLIVCTTYQTSLGILPMVLIFFAFKDGFTGEFNLKYVFKNLLFAATTILAALLVFKFLLMQPLDLYISNDFPPLSIFIPTFINNLTTYIGMVFSDFKIFWLVLIGLICLSFVIVAIRKTSRHKLVCLGLTLLCEVLMALCIFGFYSLFEKPLYAPRASYCIGAFIAFVSLFVAYYSHSILPKLVIATISWCFFVFAFTYANALSAQDQYVDEKIDRVIASLNDLRLGQESHVVQIKGDIGMTPIVEHMPQNFQMLNHLLESSYSSQTIWSTYRIIYLCDFCNFTLDPSQDLTSMKLPILKSTSEYDISGDNSHTLILFKE